MKNLKWSSPQFVPEALQKRYNLSNKKNYAIVLDKLCLWIRVLHYEAEL
jgi:hypothetical protein